MLQRHRLVRPDRRAFRPGVAATASVSTAGPIDPSNFVTTVDNPYYPLPVGRVMVYQGTRDGVAQTDTVTVTSATKVIEGVRAVVVRDVATDSHHRTLEATLDWFAQDKQGNVWYLGEDTKAYNPDGSVDTSGSWMAGVNGAIPGFIMEAHPKIPDAYRQEYLKGQAEDTAWIVGTGGSANGSVRHRAQHGAVARGDRVGAGCRRREDLRTRRSASCPNGRSPEGRKSRSSHP